MRPLRLWRILRFDVFCGKADEFIEGTYAEHGCRNRIQAEKESDDGEFRVSAVIHRGDIDEEKPHGAPHDLVHQPNIPLHTCFYYTKMQKAPEGLLPKLRNIISGASLQTTSWSFCASKLLYASEPLFWSLSVQDAWSSSRLSSSSFFFSVPFFLKIVGFDLF